ncbi:helix-turn-helix domain-containing protein [Laspinema olomoucense]|uniref:helix-turn-helix domain-containing protein n=1 Tax=Laspinema olomoucense TaxID=3231600 RepID=UPI0021BA4866|nr:MULTISPECIES: helix-turn-helix transcriptional regulator [unclassified Laspinema]MCT7990182.1 helix-turn-helix domain-containing protein [Laspinema sp. D3a]MCT7995359.1 helix-turn-helix domain-containing protein [Laspinema sp. D3c]
MTGSNLAFDFTRLSRPKSAEEEKLLSRTNSDNAVAINSTETDSFINGISEQAELNRDRLWEDVLRQLGQELEQRRQQQGLTREELYNLTHVPQHQIQALETGLIEKLPQDIYVRGFVRRLGDALGLDGSVLADSLPERNPIQTVARSTNPSKFVFSLSLSPIHLYLVYGILLVGAILGLSFQKAHNASMSPSNPALSYPVDVNP